MKLGRNSTTEGKWGVKTPQQNEIQCLEREYRIHERLNHPLIVDFDKYLPRTRDQRLEIVSEFVPDGSLADHLPYAKNQN
jgi:serine/threonine protein kinase